MTISAQPEYEETSMKAMRVADGILLTAGTACLVLTSYLAYEHGWAGHYLFLIAVAGWQAMQQR